MKIDVLNSFHKLGTSIYELSDNESFLQYLNDASNNGYERYISIDELQLFVNLITSWYEIKYPERELEHYEGIDCDYFADVKKLSPAMGLRQLLYRLSKKQFCLLKANYRSTDWGLKAVYKAGKRAGDKEYISITIKCLPDNPNYQKYAYFKVLADPETGIVEDTPEIRIYKNETEDITLDELLDRIKGTCSLDFSKLRQCVLNHNYDVELRNKILEVCALKLLYSRTTIPRRGYARASRFIGEFNKNFNFNLTTKNLEKILKQFQESARQWSRVKMPDFEDENLASVDDLRIAKTIKDDKK